MPTRAPAPAKQKRSPRIWTRKDLGVVALGITASGITAVAGVAEIPNAAMFLMGCGITAVAALATRALTVRTLKQKVNTLWWALGAALLIPLGAFAYQQWFDPSKTQDDEQVMVVSGSDVVVWRPAVTPGGDLNRFAHSPVAGGWSVNVRCYVDLATKERWYWLRTGGWLPERSLSPMPGVPQTDVSKC